jgi:hypothetical protein
MIILAAVGPIRYTNKTRNSPSKPNNTPAGSDNTLVASDNTLPWGRLT